MREHAIKPMSAGFELAIWDGMITIFVCDLDNKDNDNVRSVKHPEFDGRWFDEMENVFTAREFRTMREAKEWCESIGMKYQGFAKESESKNLNQVVKGYGNA